MIQKKIMKVAMIYLAFLTALVAKSERLVCKKGFVIDCYKEEIKPPHPPEKNEIVLPIEVLGKIGTEQSVNLYVSELPSMAFLQMTFYSLNYQNKGEIKINGGKWTPLNHVTLQIEKKSLARGGMERAAPASFKAAMPIKLQTNKNTVSFRFAKADGLSIGYRVLNIDIVTDLGKSILTTVKREEDLPGWQAPKGANAEKGKALWKTAKLITNNLKEPGKWYAHTLPPSSPIKAHCADCHVSDGSDLKMYAYSNKSIIERSKFHGLSEQEGKDIAAYIRGLDAPDKGRPWNPPYQPGENIDNAHWYAGAGLESVLESDAHMIQHLFAKKPVTQEMVYELMDNDKMADTSRTPLAIQLPDWKAWLPIVHPVDAFNEGYWEKSNAYAGYGEIVKYLSTNDDYPKEQLFAKLHDFWLGYRTFFEKGSNSKNHWRTMDGDAIKNLNGVHQDLAKTSLARLLAVQMFEIHHKYNLEMLGDKYVDPAEKPRKNTWLARQYNVYEVPPHFTSCAVDSNCHNFVGQPEETGIYESSAWYELQKVLNPGIGVSRSVVPVDYNYNPQFILKTSAKSMIPEPMRFWFSQLTMYQTRIRDADIPAGDREGFNMRTMGPWTFLGTDNRNNNYGANILNNTNQIQNGLAVMFVNAQLRQFLLAMRNPRNDLKKWPRRPIDSGEHRYLEDSAVVTPDIMPPENVAFRGKTRHYAHKIYNSIPRLIGVGSDCKWINELKGWCQKAWKQLDFSQFSCPK